MDTSALGGSHKFWLSTFAGTNRLQDRFTFDLIFTLIGWALSGYYFLFPMHNILCCIDKTCATQKGLARKTITYICKLEITFHRPAFVTRLRSLLSMCSLTRLAKNKYLVPVKRKKVWICPGRRNPYQESILLGVGWLYSQPASFRRPQVHGFNPTPFGFTKADQHKAKLIFGSKLDIVLRDHTTNNARLLNKESFLKLS